MKNEYEKYLLEEAVKENVTDIHLEPKKNRVVVRFRRDGFLFSFDELKKEEYEIMLSRLKVKAEIDISEKRKIQNGKFNFCNESNDYQVRISIMPLIYGEKMVMRILSNENLNMSLEDLGFTKNVVMSLQKINHYTSGLMLFTGSTGSGKTTTQMAILKKMKDAGKNIIMIEEPMEYFLEEVNQIEVNKNIGFDYNLILKESLRQDPDIIVIGEIRDSETAKSAVAAAGRGNLVFATMHTSNSIDAIYRFEEFGVGKKELLLVLKTIVHQRLLKKSCVNCNGTGCLICKGTGYRGRAAKGYVVDIDEKIRDVCLNDSNYIFNLIKNEKDFFKSV